MSESAVGIVTFLRDLHPVGQEGNRDFALCRVTGNKCGYVAFDSGFTHRFADIRIAASGHPLAVELDFQLVVAQSEDAELAAAIPIKAVYLVGGDRPAS